MKKQDNICTNSTKTYFPFCHVALFVVKQNESHYVIIVIPKLQSYSNDYTSFNDFIHPNGE